MTTTSDAATFWDRETSSPTHTSWMENVAVRGYINTWIMGRSDGWPFKWFTEFLQTRGTPRFERALSIGCGTGPLERDLINRDLCGVVDAFDGSLASVEIARREAVRAGHGDRIHYFIADFNRPALPRRQYDAVFFHQSLHHVSKLEKLLAAVSRSLKPGGLLYLDEYIGPSRFDWNDDLIAVHRKMFSSMVPREARRVESLSLPIQADDPSEAIRSSEIMPKVECGFDVVAIRPYGGSLLSVLYPWIDWTAAPDRLLQQLFDSERSLLESGTLPHYHALVVATPKRGLRGLTARADYFFRPKLRRLRWELRRRILSKDAPF